MIISQKPKKDNLDELPLTFDTGEILEDRTDWTLQKLKSIAISQALGFKLDNMTMLKRSERVLACNNSLIFGVASNGDKRLVNAMFCRDRMCPSCQKRRSLKVYHQVQEICLYLMLEQRGIQFALLTLTVPNVDYSELSSTIKMMNKAVSGMFARKEVKKAVTGTFRTLEVTKNKSTGQYHPHFHILVSVKSNYFKGRDYINHERWLQLWQESTKMPEITQVDIRKIKPNSKRKTDAVVSACAEVAKYATKPSDYLSKGKSGSWFADPETVSELADALSYKRLVIFTGVFKEMNTRLKISDSESDSVDLVNITGEHEDNILYVMKQIFRWDHRSGVYVN